MIDIPSKWDRPVVGTLATIMALAMAVLSPAWAQSELTAQEIVDKSIDNNSLGIADAVSRVTLKLVNRRGRSRVREIEIRSIEVGDKNRTLVRFHSPADVQGTSFLRRDLDGEDEEQYLYLPALGKVKRITGSQRNSRFMGTDLTYADLENRSLKDATLKRLPDAEIGKNSVYVIEAIPNADADSEYGKTISWIGKKSFVPLQVQFYDKDLELIKELKVKRLAKKSGNWVAMKSQVENVRKKTKTILEINSIQFNVSLDEKEFTKRALVGG